VRRHGKNGSRSVAAAESVLIMEVEMTRYEERPALRGLSMSWVCTGMAY